MRVEDRRELFEHVPAVEMLNRIIPLIPKQCFKGIHRLLLLDRDPFSRKRKHRAVGRYLAQKPGAEIHLYFEKYAALPPDLATNQVFVAYNLAKVLLHELYHHKVAYEKRRKPPFKCEQANADDWGESGARWLLKQLFDRETYEAELQKIKSLANGAEFLNPPA